MQEEENLEPQEDTPCPSLLSIPNFIVTGTGTFTPPPPPAAAEDLEPELS